MGREWINLEEVGTLEVETVLVTFDVPILFVCKNSRDRRFLVLCIDEEEGEYVIAEESTDSLIQMIDNKKTMEYVFRNAKNQILYVTKYDFGKQSFVVKKYNSKKIDKELLPKEGEYFELNNEKIIHYKEKLKDKVLICSKEKTKYRVISLDDYSVKRMQSIISAEYSQKEYIEVNVSRNSVIKQHRLAKQHLIA